MMFDSLKKFSSTFTKPAKPAKPAMGGTPAAERWVRLLIEQRLGDQCRGRQVGRTSDGEEDGLLDVRVAGPGDPKDTQVAFERLRWGGLFACIDPNPERVGKLMHSFDASSGFVIEREFDEIWNAPLGIRIPGITPQAFYFTARKTHLVTPGESTDRFTYDVTLQADDKEPTGYFVRKQVPTVDDIVSRLARRFPDLDPKDAQLRAMKLVTEVFPIFLTREAKVLEALQKSMPAEFRGRVPRPIRVKTNDKGFVTRLDMQWLRNGGRPITQLEFAKQAAELLSVLHDRAGIMHLDLRLDNVVITQGGVGFVDFGSAVQVGERLESSPVLNSLFTEMMRTSQVQRVLGQMLEKGDITNEALAAVHGKVDRSVDAFYLAVQINRPHGNPELAKLIDYNPMSETAKALETLTAAVLRPKTPDHADFKTAADILRGIKRIEQRFAA